MKRTLLIWLLGAAVGAPAAHGQESSRAWDVEVNLTGAFVRMAGNLLTDATVDRLTVGGWGWPGATAGTRVSGHVWAGYSFQPGLDLHLFEAWGFGGPRDGHIELAHRTGSVHAVSLRAGPERVGLFGSLAIQHARPTRYHMSYTRSGPTVALGNGSYATDLEVVWRTRPSTSLALGLGYRKVHRSGVSWTLGISFPLSTPRVETPSFEPVDRSILIASSDLEAARASVASELFYLPVLFHVSVGRTWRSVARGR